MFALREVETNAYKIYMAVHVRPILLKGQNKEYLHGWPGHIALSFTPIDGQKS